MRKYEENFNEDYERGYEDGRREALLEINSEDFQELLKEFKLKEIDKSKQGNGVIFYTLADTSRNLSIRLALINGKVQKIKIKFSSEEFIPVDIDYIKSSIDNVKNFFSKLKSLNVLKEMKMLHESTQLEEFRTKFVQLESGLHAFKLKADIAWEIPEEYAGWFDGIKSQFVTEGFKLDAKNIKEGQSYWFVNSEHKSPVWIFKATVKSIDYNPSVLQGYGYGKGEIKSETTIVLETKSGSEFILNDYEGGKLHNKYIHPSRSGMFVSESKLFAKMDRLEKYLKDKKSSLKR